MSPRPFFQQHHQLSLIRKLSEGIRPSHWKTMTKIKFTRNDLHETSLLADLLKKIDNIDEDYVRTTVNEIAQYQPFFLSVLLGHQDEVSMEELDEITRIYFLTWEYFRLKPNIQTKQVTESLFVSIDDKNIDMLRYAQDEPNENAQGEVYSHDLQNIKSKSLITAIFFRFNERPVLSTMDIQKKAVVMIGIKSFIECFETI